MRKRILITGMAGFAGSHLAEHLCDGSDVWGIHLDDNLGNVSHIAGKVRSIRCDLLDPSAVEKAVGEARPDVLFHLAAQSIPSASFESPAGTLRTNIFSTLNLLEAVKKQSPGARMLNAGSGDEYGDVEDGELPVKETARFRPENPYAVSKVAADMLSYQYWRSDGLDIIRLRPFNHFGPRQSDRFVASAFAKQIAEIEAGIRGDKALRVGNLDASRDFLHVKDVVRAYTILMEKGVSGEAYNICSGRAVRIRDILEILLSLTVEKIEVIQDAGRVRARDSRAKYGDYSKLKALGWSPAITLKDGLKDLLDYWRSALKRG